MFRVTVSRFAGSGSSRLGHRRGREADQQHQGNQAGAHRQISGLEWPHVCTRLGRRDNDFPGPVRAPFTLFADDASGNDAWHRTGVRDGSAEALAQERRARLAAERLLDKKQSELSVANRQLSQHAQALSVEIIEKREEVAEVRSENIRVTGDLKVAEIKVEIAERRLWTSLRSIRDGFAVFDADDRLVAANPAWLAPFDGLEAVAPGASYGDILRIGVEEGTFNIGQDRPADWLAMMLARLASDDVEPLVIRLWDGAYIRLVDERAEGGDRVSLALNITEAMQTEHRLNEALDTAEAANRAKSAFLANMSHELRTPMNGVVGMADLLSETALDEDQKSFVDTIRNSGEALLVIINDVLDYSKLEADRMVLHPEPFDLEEVILDVVQLMQTLVHGKALSLRVDYDMFMPTRFTGDRGRVRQVLTNLIGNAVKFTETGHVLVRATGLPGRAPALHRITVMVEDSGIGIAPEMLGHVFGQFNQVEGDRNRKFEGTGLGLSIARRLVELMAGEIWAESVPGQGSTFAFSIELAAAGDASAAEPPDLAGREVVIVDPVAASAAVLEGQLLALGLAVTVFAEGADALAALPDATAAIFAEAALPDMTAADLAGALANDGLAIPVFAVTPTRSGAAQPGCARTLHRPVPRQALREALAGIPPQPLGRPAPDLRVMRVLAAEDNKTNQLVLGKMLRDLRIDLRFAANGVEAVAAHADWAPDLIFMDISMPEMDGKEATRRIRAAEAAGGRHTPIVAVTAHALAGDDAAILAAGLDHYLTKPLKKPALVDRIRAARPPGCHPVDAPLALPATPSLANALSNRPRAAAAT